MLGGEGKILVEVARVAVVGGVERALPLEQPLSTRTSAAPQTTFTVRHSGQTPKAVRLTTLDTSNRPHFVDAAPQVVAAPVRIMAIWVDSASADRQLWRVYGVRC